MRTVATHIMKKDPCRLNINDTINKGISMMIEGDFRHLPVVRDRQVVGMISVFDLIRLEADSIDTTTAGAVMNAPALCIRMDEKLDEFIHLFVESNLHSIPVVNYQNQLVGIISTSDLIGYLNNELKTALIMSTSLSA